jgi:hypothetical protein
LTYDGNDDWLSVTQNDTSQFTIFIVADADNTSLSEYTSVFGTAQDPGTGGSFQLDIGGSVRGCSGNYRFHGQDDTDFVVACLGSYSTSPDLLTYQTTASGSNTQVSTYQDGVSQGTATLDNTTPLFEAYKIGINRSSNSPWNGNIAEEILYYGSLNTAERILVENYLSAKYNIALDSSAKDVYAGHAISYTVDVAGIGRESDGTNLEAHSAGLVMVTDSDPASSLLNDVGDYTTFGHAGQPDPGESGGIVPVSVSGYPDINERWARVWYVNRTEGVSAGLTATLSFDFSEAGAVGDPSSVGASNYYLLRSTNPWSGGFSVTPIDDALKSVNGNRVEFKVTCPQLSDGLYYTLGADTEPLNVSLSEFEAAWQKNGVAVDWATTMEIGTAGFHVWRSTSADGEYVKVSNALIPSADPGSNAGGSYHFEDAQVKPGKVYFYKLEEVEMGGVTNWYGPISTGDGGMTPNAVRVVQAAALRFTGWLPALGMVLGLGAFLWVRKRRR